MWSLMRHTESQEYQAWKRHKVWCFLCNPCDTHCLFHRPWRRPCLISAFRMFRVLPLILTPWSRTVFFAPTMYSMPQANYRL